MIHEDDEDFPEMTVYLECEIGGQPVRVPHHWPMVTVTRVSPEHWPPHIGDMWQHTTTDELWMCAASVKRIDGMATGVVGMICAHTSEDQEIEAWYERTEGDVVLVYRDGVR